MSARGNLASAEIRIHLRQMRALMQKELQQLLRDRMLLGFIVYIFTLHIVISTLGMSLDLRRSPTLVHDADRSAASRAFVYGLRPPYFAPPRAVQSEREGLERLDQGGARMLVEIPPGFERTLLRGEESARVQLLVDSSKATLAYLAASYTSRMAQRLSAEFSQQSLARRGVDARALPAIESRVRTSFNFALNDQWPGALTVLLTMMTVACVILPAAAAVRERERGTIEQLLVSPLTPLQIMLAKCGSMVLVSVTGTAISLFLVMQPLFGMPLRGSVALLLAVTALYAFANAGLGLALASVARSSGQVGLLSILVIMPIIQLSGTFSPIESMPVALQYAVRLSPLLHFVRVAFGIVFRGDGVLILWQPILAICGIGAGFFALGLWRFRRTLA
jgi:ABC-2 type transport system permease protein